MKKQLKKRKDSYKQCKDCKATVNKLSRKGLCSDCSIRRATNAILQLQVKEGEVYDKWHKNVIDGMKKADQKRK